MPLFRQRREFRDAPDVSRWVAVVGAIFILSAVVTVAKIELLRFDRVFYAAAAVSALILFVSKHRFAYVATAFGWMGLRLLVGGAFKRNWRAAAVGALFGAIAYGALLVAARREQQDRLTDRWSS